jgi:SAM-dependent methyltransferase
MHQEPEATRVADVYAAYDRDRARARRWDRGNPGNRRAAEERLERLRGVLRSVGLWPPARLLEIGCGGGGVLEEVVDGGVPVERVVGVDLLASRLPRTGVGAALACADGRSLPFATGSFDVVLLYTLLSSVPDDRIAREIAAEAARVVRPGGAVACYDLRISSPRNSDLVAVSPRRLEALFPGWAATSETLTLLPPLARRLGVATRRLYPVLVRVGALRSHRLTVLRRPSSVT